MFLQNAPNPLEIVAYSMFVKYIMCFVQFEVSDPTSGLPAPLQIRGKTLDAFVAENQSRMNNALTKSEEAAFQAFTEQLKSDQAMFDSDVILKLGSDMLQNVVV